ncbi:hypothetical protein F4777DRAFT_355550 [Nemania sp. FL0916]|nr:hypothetical protein F4777DRAFT_355550 [Nemania sp. FL0916]
MSQKITSKNLTYDTSLPPFLARLRGQQTAQSGPDPILAAQRRPGQKRSASEEAEDAPIVVDEDGNVVQLKDGQLDGDSGSSALRENNGTDEADGNEKHGSDHAAEEGDPAHSKEKEKVAGIGAARKRKVGRVIAEEESDDDGVNKTKGKRKDEDSKAKARIAKASADVRRLVHEDDEAASRRDSGVSASTTNDRKPQNDGPQRSTVKGTKKKPAKKIKLSFGDNDDGE